MNGCTFALKLEILILFILDEHRVVKRGVHFFDVFPLDLNKINGFL